MEENQTLVIRIIGKKVFLSLYIQKVKLKIYLFSVHSKRSSLRKKQRNTSRSFHFFWILSCIFFLFLPTHNVLTESVCSARLCISLARWYRGWSCRCPSRSGGLWEGCCCWSCCCCCGWRSERRELHCRCYSPVCRERPGRAERSCRAGSGSAGGRDPLTPRPPPLPSPCYSAERHAQRLEQCCFFGTVEFVFKLNLLILPDDSLLVKTRKSSDLLRREKIKPWFNTVISH